MCVKLQEFYEDLFLELSKYGEIESLNVCDNLADHMVCSLDLCIKFSLFIINTEIQILKFCIGRWVMYTFSSGRKNMLKMQSET